MNDQTFFFDFFGFFLAINFSMAAAYNNEYYDLEDLAVQLKSMLLSLQLGGNEDAETYKVIASLLQMLEDLMDAVEKGGLSPDKIQLIPSLKVQVKNIIENTKAVVNQILQDVLDDLTDQFSRLTSSIKRRRRNDDTESFNPSKRQRRL